MIVDVEKELQALEERHSSILNGLCAKGKSPAETEFDRGRIAELKHIISRLRDRAAEMSR